MNKRDGAGLRQDVPVGAGGRGGGEILDSTGLRVDIIPGGAPSTTDYLVKTADPGLSAERVVTDTTSITWDWATAGQAKADVATAGVTSAMLRNSSALSVIGRSANSAGVPADIAAGAASGAVLRESGSILGFGTVATAGLANGAVTYAKIQNATATQRVLGRNSGGGGVFEEVTVSQELDWVTATQGQIPYRGAATWAGLATGTSGQVLTTGGAGANPSWGYHYYTLQGSTTINAGLTDAQTTYFGSMPFALTANTNYDRIYVPLAGTIVAAYVYAFAVTVAGSNEAWTMNIRKNNSGVSTAIATTNAATAVRTWQNAAMNLAVAAGDFLHIESVAPTWATNPTDVWFAGTILVRIP